MTDHAISGAPHGSRPSPVPPAREARSDEDLAFHEHAIVTAAALHLAEHRHVVLSYSGGAESGLLLHLLRPFRQGFTVVWNNPGALPHEADHIRTQAAGGPFVEVASDRAAYWKAHGLPTALVPADAMTLFPDDGGPPDPPLSPYKLCCANVRWRTSIDWCAANGVTLRIHGQRHGEGSTAFLPGPKPFSEWAPLATWSREEAMRRVEHHGVPLPRQYAEGYPTSIECGVCPANLAPARMAFLRKHYPAEAAETVRLASVVMKQVTEAYDWQRAVLTEVRNCAEPHPAL